jgi:phosphate starvation-inducible PhoH-like protein
MRKQTKHSTFNFECQYSNLQKKVINFYRTNTVSIITGDPGTGKTFTAIYYALMMLKDGAVEEIIISKPLIEVGSKLGFLPGTEQEKVSVYMDSYAGTFKKIIGEGPYNNLLNSKKVRFEPVNYVRGTTFENAIVIMDESQGLSLHELVTFVTRISESSQLILLGDLWQADIKNSGLDPFIRIARGIDKIDHMELGDEYQMRNPMIVNLYKNYKQYLANKL